MKRSVLGQGLSALIGNQSSNISDVLCDDIILNPYQPRKFIDEIKLQELSHSIIANGVITPIIVRKSSDGKFELVAGERRLRAAKIAGLSKIPAHILSVTDDIACEMALLENIQREDLTIIDEAHGYQNLITVFHYTQEKIADRIGKSRSHVANILRILNLPEKIQSMINDGLLSFGHAKILLQSKNCLQDAEMIVTKGLSVREYENITKGASDFSKKIENLKNLTVKDSCNDKLKKISVIEDQQELTRIQDFIAEKLNLSVKVEARNEGIVVEISCQNALEISRILKIISLS
ncbi:ParB/RepB/Spo0J family partition protein [Candidatus Gromoviella agglomerans]|uniref:ParB/RepB/Spo0J family partition protein n=1 Tax=Candidatus Gromoviella agglomerans TaxID=2806609 RepID=UPI001E38585A|nr:ParB/RepB/Spo0J family partition protein [Candidatus Gromoviella agglomerans]UFX98457.1 ParB/RepB/Spo0J family partition protein [Candidatus Gromoviella agglomerans]